MEPIGNHSDCTATVYCLPLLGYVHTTSLVCVENADHIADIFCVLKKNASKNATCFLPCKLRLICRSMSLFEAFSALNTPQTTCSISEKCNAFYASRFLRM